MCFLDGGFLYSNYYYPLYAKKVTKRPITEMAKCTMARDYAVLHYLGTPNESSHRPIPICLSSSAQSLDGVALAPVSLELLPSLFSLLSTSPFSNL